MKNDLSPLFEDEKFQQLLAQYEDMVRQKTHTYFEVHDLTLIAEYYASKGRRIDAGKVIDYGLTLHPDNLDLQLYACHNLMSLGEFQEAQDLLDSLPDQNDREVLFTRAALHIDMGQDRKAEAIFEHIAEQENNNTLTLLDIADVCMDNNHPALAYRWLSKAYEKEPENLKVIESMADYEASYGEAEQAVAYLNKLLDEKPFHLPYWHDLIQCLMQNKDNEKALEAIDFALAIDENNIKTKEMQGYCYLQMGDVKKTCEIFTEIADKSAHRSDIFQVLGDCYMAQKNYEQAILYYTRAIDSGKLCFYELACCHQKRASCLLRSSADLQLVQQDLNKSFTYDGTYAPIFLTQGEVFLCKRQLKKAQIMFLQALTYADDKEGITEAVALAYFQWEYYEEALKAFQLLESAGEPEYLLQNYFLMAFCYFLDDDMQNTVKCIIKGLRARNFENILADEEETPDIFKDEDFFQLIEEVKKEYESGRLSLEE